MIQEIDLDSGCKYLHIFIWINDQRRPYWLSRRLCLHSETIKLLIQFFFLFTQLKFFFSFNVVTIATMITCNIIIGTVAITHFQFESTVGMNYQNQNNQDYNRTEEEFKPRNGAGETGLTVYSTLMVLISSDVLLSAFLVLISRDLFKVRQSTLFVSSACKSLNKNQEGRLGKGKMPYLAPRWSSDQPPM